MCRSDGPLSHFCRLFLKWLQSIGMGGRKSLYGGLRGRGASASHKPSRHWLASPGQHLEALPSLLNPHHVAHFLRTSPCRRLPLGQACSYYGAFSSGLPSPDPVDKIPVPLPRRLLPLPHTASFLHETSRRLCPPQPQAHYGHFQVISSALRHYQYEQRQSFWWHRQPSQPPAHSIAFPLLVANRLCPKSRTAHTPDKFFRIPCGRPFEIPTRLH